MAVKVRISPALRRQAGPAGEIESSPGTIGGLLRELERNCPEVADMISADGKAGRLINIYINEEDVRVLGGEHAEVKDGDEVFITRGISEG